MLFNSCLFVFLFLPVVLLGFFVLGRAGNLAPVIWLALGSLVFYSVSNWQFVLAGRSMQDRQYREVAAGYLSQ